MTALAIFTASVTTNVLTVSAVQNGTLAVGQYLVGVGIPVNTQITALGSGTGGTGTYTLSASLSGSPSGSMLTVLQKSYNTGDNYKSVLPFLDKIIPSTLKQAQFAQYVDFITAYFTWLEQQGNVFDLINSLDSIADSSIGGLDPNWYPSFRKENLPLLPNTIESNHREVLNHIVNFYLSKGTAVGIEFLFRLLYNVSIALSYPGNRLLDSTISFKKPVYVVRFNLVSGVLSDFENTTLVGQTSGAIITTSEGSTTTVGLNTVVEVVVQSASADLTSGETIKVQVGTSNGTVIQSAGGYVINAGGSGYRVGESVPINASSGTNFIAYISQVYGSLNSVTVDNGGGGYTTTPNVVIIGDGTGATAHAVMSGGVVTGIVVDTAGQGYTNIQIRVQLNPGDPYPTKFAHATGNLLGSVQAIDITDPGYNYATAPTVNYGAMTGTGLNVTLKTTRISQHVLILSNSNGNLDIIPLQNYYIVLVLKDGAGNFIPGETIYQPTGQFTHNDFLTTVVSWDRFTRTLIVQGQTKVTLNLSPSFLVQDELIDSVPHPLSVAVVPVRSILHNGYRQVRVEQFDKTLPIVGNSSHSSWTFGSKYFHPFYIDAGDGDIWRQFNYYITSFGISQDVWSANLKNNAHVAGTQFNVV